MKVVLDRNKCSTLGMCESVAPDIFEVGEDGELHVLQWEPPEEERETVEEACEACPTGALSIEG